MFLFLHRVAVFISDAVVPQCLSERYRLSHFISLCLRLERFILVFQFLPNRFSFCSTCHRVLEHEREIIWLIISIWRDTPPLRATSQMCWKDIVFQFTKEDDLDTFQHHLSFFDRHRDVWGRRLRMSLVSFPSNSARWFVLTSPPLFCLHYCHCHTFSFFFGNQIPPHRLRAEIVYRASYRLFVKWEKAGHLFVPTTSFRLRQPKQKLWIRENFHLNSRSLCCCCDAVCT